MESAYQVASRTALALLNISAAFDDDRWPDKMYFSMLAEALEHKDVVDAACEWIPPQLVHVCGIAGTSVHELLMELAHAGNVIGLLGAIGRADAPPRSPKEALGIFANYSAGDVEAMLRVERRRAMDAIEAGAPSPPTPTARGSENSEGGDVAPARNKRRKGGRPRKPGDEKRERKLVEAYRLCRSTEEIAKRFDTTQKEVALIVKRHNERARQARKRRDKRAAD